MPSPELVIVDLGNLPRLPGVTVSAAPGLSAPAPASPNAILAAGEAANDATYRTSMRAVASESLGLLGRALGVLGLVFTPGNTGPDRTGELNEPLREPTPELEPVVVVGSFGDRRAPDGSVDTGGAYDLVELPEIVIQPGPRERSNPLRVPPPDLLPEPFQQPIFEPFGVPSPKPVSPGSPSAQPRPRTTPESTPAPGVQADPLSDPFSFPRLQPNPEPAPRPNARPVPDPATRPQPTPRGPLLEPTYFPEIRTPLGDVTSRILDRVLNPEPGISYEPQPDAAEDPCDCGKGKKKDKKKRKKPEPRTICWKGTYVQRAKGISYSRKEQVPCAGGAIDVIRKARRKLKTVPKFDPLTLEF